MSKTEEISPSTMQRDTESTPETQRKLRVIARFLEDTPGHRDFNPLRFGHIRPDNPHQPIPPARRPTETTDTSHVETHEQAS